MGTKKLLGDWQSFRKVDRRSRGSGNPTLLTTFCEVDKITRSRRRSGRAVECAGLENRWARKGPVGSNPTSSASKSQVLTLSARQTGTFALIEAVDVVDVIPYSRT